MLLLTAVDCLLLGDTAFCAERLPEVLLKSGGFVATAGFDLGVCGRGSSACDDVVGSVFSASGFGKGRGLDEDEDERKGFAGAGDGDEEISVLLEKGL